MPPKADPTAVAYVTIRQFGGEPGPTSVLAPKLGPLGVPPKKASDEIVAATQKWKGVKVTVRLKIQNRQVSCEVVPTATSLLIKALKEPIRDRKKKELKNIKHSGNLGIDAVIDVARQMRQANRGIISKTLTGTVKEILGTANAIGCTVNGMKPTDVQKAIDAGEVEIPAE